MVGFKQKLAIGDENLVEDMQKILLDQSPFVVTGFWPGIGAEEVEA
jgi:hypothetical protein